MPLLWSSLPLSQRFSFKFFSVLERASREWRRERKRERKPSLYPRPFAARSLSRREKFQEKPLTPGHAFLTGNDNIDLKKEGLKQLQNLCEMNIVCLDLQSSGIFWFMFFHCMGVKTLLPLIRPANQSPNTHPLHTWATPPVRPQHRTMKTLAETRREKYLLKKKQ